MVKKTGPGRAKFVNMLNEMKRQTRPALSRDWEAFSVVFREFLAKQAGVPVANVKGALFDMSEHDRRKLLVAGQQIAALVVSANKILSDSVMSKV